MNPLSSSTSKPKIAFMSAWGPPHARLAKSLIDAGLNLEIVHLTPGHSPTRKPLWRRVLAHPWASVSSRVRETFLNRHLRAIDNDVRGRLFPEGMPSPSDLDALVHEIPIWQVNRKATVAKLRSISPEIVISSGAPMLKSRIYEVATIATINTHWGIAPAYRGGHTLFWALFHRDQTGLGYTLHKVERGSDTGGIYFQRHVPTEQRASEADCWVACANDAAMHIPSSLHSILSGQLPPAPQSDAGHLYRYRDRTLLAQLRYALFRRGKAWQR